MTREEFIEIGDKAKNQGYTAIKYSSMRGEGFNFTIMSESKDFFNNILMPKKVEPIIQ
jgi:hypothetical protein